MGFENLFAILAGGILTGIKNSSDGQTAMQLADELADAGTVANLSAELSTREICRRAVAEYGAARKEENCVLFQLTEQSPVEKAVRMVGEAAARLREIDGFFDPDLHNLAMRLTHYGRSAPLSGRELQACLNCDERTVKARIAELRTRWALPIGSVRTQPGGYFFITDLEDFRTWIDAFTKQPLDELRTIRSLVRRHFPELSGQLGFDLTERKEVAS